MTREVVEARTVHQRVWVSTEDVEVRDLVTGQLRTEERTSQVIEVGDFLCYRDPVGGWVPSMPRWTQEAGAFVSEGVGYRVVAPGTCGEALRYYPADDDSEVLLRLEGLFAVDCPPSRNPCL